MAKNAPKGSQPYKYWNNKKPTASQAKEAVKQYQDAQAAVDTDTKALSSAQGALKRKLDGTKLLTIARYVQTGTNADLYISTYTQLPTVNTYIYIRDLDSVPNATFLDPSYQVHMVKVTAVNSGQAKVTVAVQTSTNLDVKPGGPAYFSPFKGPTTSAGLAYWKGVSSAWTAKNGSAANLKSDTTTQEKLKKKVDEIPVDLLPKSYTPSGVQPGADFKVVSNNDQISYNIPSVKWAYFSTNVGTNSKLGYDSILLNQGGSPAGSKLLTDAKQLWSGANTGSHKGMLQTYSYWKNKIKTTSPVNKDPNLPDWYLNTQYQTKRFGFQFLYNPGSVSMGWGGIPNVDPGQLMSGKDVTPWITPSQTSSYIQFDLLINRMPDMALINSAGVTTVANSLPDYYGISASSSDLATADTTYLEELKAIQELGTMYDLEYLLGTLIGFREYSALRGRYTSDFGFLMGIPVELHLGKQLRYVGTINDLTVNHTIFTEGMIPVFTNVSITFNRRVEPFNGSAEISSTGSLLTSDARAEIRKSDTPSIVSRDTRALLR